MMYACPEASIPRKGIEVSTSPSQIVRKTFLTDAMRCWSLLRDLFDQTFAGMGSALDSKGSTWLGNAYCTRLVEWPSCLVSSKKK